MQKILELIAKTIKEFEDDEFYPRDGFDEGIVEGMIIIEKKLIETAKPHLKITGVCGVCNKEYPTYKQATECCVFAKGSGYENQLNQVFQVRGNCQT